MEIKVNKPDLQAALVALKPYFNSANEWPFVSAFSGDNGAWLYSVDRNGSSLTAYWIAADIAEDTEVTGIVGDMLEALVKATSGESVVLRSTDSNLFVEDMRKFKGRLARSTAMPSLMSTVIEKRQNVETDLTATLPVDSLERLLRLSLAFPATSVSDMRYCRISFVANEDCSGSVQESEAGGIEQMPLLAADIVGSGDIIALTPLFNSIVRNGRERLTVQAGTTRKSPLMVTDPDNPIWWTLAAQTRLAGENIE